MLTLITNTLYVYMIDVRKANLCLGASPELFSHVIFSQLYVLLVIAGRTFIQIGYSGRDGSYPQYQAMACQVREGDRYGPSDTNSPANDML